MYNKVVLEGETLMDLTEDTVNPSALLQGYTAHDRSGNQIDGAYELPMNSKRNPGSVEAGEGHIEEFWGTDVLGNPGWRPISVADDIKKHNLSPEAHPYIQRKIGDLQTKVDNTSTDVKNEIDTLQRYVMALYDELSKTMERYKVALETLNDESVKKADVQDNFDSTETQKPSSANIVRVIKEMLDELTRRFNVLADSDDTTLDQLSEIVSYIKSNRTLIEGITTEKVSVSDIVDSLSSTDQNKPLSANMGRELDTKKVNVSDIVNNTNSTDQNKPLSANVGHNLDVKIDQQLNGLTTIKTDIPDIGKDFHAYFLFFDVTAIMALEDDVGDFQCYAVFDGIYFSTRRSGNGTNGVEKFILSFQYKKDYTNLEYCTLRTSNVSIIKPMLITHTETGKTYLALDFMGFGREIRLFGKMEAGPKTPKVCTWDTEIDKYQSVTSLIRGFDYTGTCSNAIRAKQDQNGKAIDEHYMSFDDLVNDLSTIEPDQNKPLGTIFGRGINDLFSKYLFSNRLRYWIDPVNGDNNNDGTSFDKAFKNLDPLDWHHKPYVGLACNWLFIVVINDLVIEHLIEIASNVGYFGIDGTVQHNVTIKFKGTGSLCFRGSYNHIGLINNKQETNPYKMIFDSSESDYSDISQTNRHISASGFVLWDSIIRFQSNAKNRRFTIGCGSYNWIYTGVEIKDCRLTLNQGGKFLFQRDTVWNNAALEVWNCEVEDSIKFSKVTHEFNTADVTFNENAVVVDGRRVTQDNAQNKCPVAACGGTMNAGKSKTFNLWPGYVYLLTIGGYMYVIDINLQKTVYVHNIVAGNSVAVSTGSSTITIKNNTSGLLSYSLCRLAYKEITVV